MLASQLESEEKEDGKVAIAVTIDEELLRRVDASLHLGEKEGEAGELQNISSNMPIFRIHISFADAKDHEPQMKRMRMKK